ncbi:nickel pincer cofactor biosynthesis protein LarC [Parathermosynechococcus lividus]
MNVAYFDCPAGIAGDMCLGALIDGGVPLDYLHGQLAKLGIAADFTLTIETVQRKGQRGLKAHVQLHEHSHPHHRHWPDIQAQILAADLPDRARDWSLRVFEALAIAEGAVHGIAPTAVHFHEVGAVDALVDIVGTCLGLDYLGIEQIYCSPLPTGGGTVRAAHGQLPVPVPAVLQLWQTYRVPVYSNGIANELVTPTGAAIVCALSQEFGTPPAMTLERVGLGAGSHELPLPNLLRLWLGETPNRQPPTPTAIVELQTQLDDLPPQALAYAIEQLYATGAVEVFCQAITMKKSRLGVLLTVLCPLSAEAACVQTLFRETTTLGLRRQLQDRYILQRQIKTVTTPFGEVRLKLATDGHGHPLNVQPEYEDCAALARQHQQPWQVVYHAALKAGLTLWPLASSPEP